MIEHAQEVSLGERFEFGANWTRFLALLNEDRIRLAERSLHDLLEAENAPGQDLPGYRIGQRAFLSRRAPAGR